MDHDSAPDQPHTSGSSDQNDPITFAAFGRAYPERVSWWLSPLSLESLDGDGRLAVRLRVAMSQSQFMAEMTLPRSTGKDVDPLDAKNQLEDFVRSALDAIALRQGAAVDCEVVQLGVPGGDTLVLDSSFRGLELEMSDDAFRMLLIAAQIVRGVRLGLADFRLAIRTPADTAFLAYRALDGIRADIADRERISHEASSWDRMRTITCLERAEIEAVKALADPRRHGALVPISHNEREGALKLLQRALVAYSVWCAANTQPLRDLVEKGSTRPREGPQR